MKTSDIIGLTLGAIGLALIYEQFSYFNEKTSYDQELLSLGLSADIVGVMTQSEKKDTYQIVMLQRNNRPVPEALKQRGLLLSTKYKIFT